MILTLLDKLDLIESFTYPNGKIQVGEILEKQKELFRLMGVDVLESLGVLGM